ncbi:SGNH/GDSL hydrolase family protein [Novosphingobium jiangmenense]|nr:SGNH/GDSL hydrolase family protein [Novosphingobium jiangmenense]
MRPRGIAGLTAAVLTLAGGMAAWTGEVPRWTGSGTRMVLPDLLRAGPADPIPLPPEGLILFVGDSNTAGSRIGGASGAYPAVFAKTISGHPRVQVHAFGGATVADLLQRPLPKGPLAVAFVMLGTNDAATRGWLSEKRRVPLETYRSNLSELARRLHKAGASVVILAPPPVGSTAMTRRLAPYRLAAREVAEDTSSDFRDPVAAFLPSPQTAYLQRDALHLTPEAQRELGLWLATHTTSASETGSSSTGKPSPPSASHPS